MRGLMYLLVLYTLLLQWAHGNDAQNCSHGIEWRCANGECIDAYSVCNGYVDCADGSDETTNNCIVRTCPSYSFRCSYGACIPATRKCDGKRDCRDNSDEFDWACLKNNGEVDAFERKLQGYCRDENRIQCTSGECISDYDLCDGEADCRDGSDETLEYCTKFVCPSFAFRCAYGACVSGKAKCNGLIDCYDGSDELPGLCGYQIYIGNNSIDIETPVSTTNHMPIDLPTTTTANGLGTEIERPETTLRDCIVPTHRKSIILTNFITNEQYKAGDRVSGNKTTVTLQCGHRKRLEGSNVGLCVDGEWVKGLARCSKTEFCSNNKLIHPLSITAACFFNSTKINCREPLVTGTIVHATCSTGYTSKATGTDTIIAECQAEGKWSQRLPNCKPICGMALQSTPNEFKPWFVSIFRKNVYGNYFFECNGTIVSEQIVVAAANCVSDGEADNKDDSLESDDPTIFRVVEGFYNLAFSDAQQTGRKVHNVAKIELPSETANDNSRKYVGLIFLEDALKFSPYVAPICLPNKRMNDHIQYILTKHNNSHTSTQHPIFDVRFGGSSTAYLTTVAVPTGTNETSHQYIHNFVPDIKRLLRNNRNLY